MSTTLKRANEHLGIEKETYEATGAFNSVLGVDALFFVDPLLLQTCTVPEFAGSLEKVRGYFQEVITLIRVNNEKAEDKAVMMLTLKEVRGVGIGYGSERADGSAIGKVLATRLKDTAKELLEMGISDPAIFEVMGLFEKDFGPDRLSDALIRILLDNVLSYSERITIELDIKDTIEIKTYSKTYTLAQHPLKKGPIVFLPESILRDIPVANNFEGIGDVVAFTEDLRDKFNSIIAPCFAGDEKPTKPQIRDYLMDKKQRMEMLVAIYHASQPEHYDFEKDPEGLNLWLEKAIKLVKENPLVVPEHPTGEKDLDEVVKKIIEKFKNFIETKGGWKSLYNDEKKKLNESHAGHFFYATALAYCGLSDIDISPQSNAGQGPVDFKLSKGASQKIVVEIKLTSGSVAHGYIKQTRIYQASEEAQKSYYIVVQVTKTNKALEDILERAEQEDQEGKKHPEIVVVDGREKPSASNA